jgi:hypothetical protein
MAALALAGSTALITWWTTTLMGLPDIGDPFDVAAFERPIPNDTNAFVLYKQAAAILPKSPPNPTGVWKTATLAEREWLDQSREALEVWLKGTERPDALEINPGVRTLDTRLDASMSLRMFAKLGLLEGSRLEEAGDFEGAFGWYRAVLRSSRHLGRRGGFIERLHGISIHSLTCTRLTRWAVEPKLDARMLRQALDDAIAAWAATPPASDGLKADYLGLIHSFDDPELMLRLHDYKVVPDDKGGSITLYGQNGWKSSLLRVGRRAINEPERSRRVIRLIFANWLAYGDLPPARQPPRVLSGTNIKPTGSAQTLLNDLFVVGDDAPGPARALPAEKLARWYDSSMDAELGLTIFTSVEKTIARERVAQGSLLVTLANELHKREHGRYPDQIEELVGPYLKALPDGYKSVP